MREIREGDRKSSTKDSDQRTWWEQSKRLPSLEKQYNYFSEGFRKGEQYHPWAWAGIGLVWLQKGNLEGAIDAFEKALAVVPDLPGIALQLKLAREKAVAQSTPSPEPAPEERPALEVPVSTQPTETKRGEMITLKKSRGENARKKSLEEDAFKKSIEKTMELIERAKIQSRSGTKTKRREGPANNLTSNGMISGAPVDRRPFLNKVLFTPAQEYAQTRDYVALCLDAGELHSAIHALAYAEKIGLDFSPTVKDLHLVESIGEKMKKESSPSTDSKHLCLEGRYLLYTGCLTQAEVKIREAIMRDPQDAENWISLGEIEHRIGLEEEHSETCGKILALDPGNMPALVGLANAFEAAGATTEAEEAYRRLLALPNPSMAAFTGLSRILAEQGRYAEAEQIIRNATRDTPEDAHLWGLLGHYLMERGKYEQALPVLRKALALEPDNHLYQWIVELCGAILNGEVDPSDPQFARKPAPKGLFVKLVELSDRIGIQYKTYEQGPYFGAIGVRLLPPLNQYTKPSPNDPDFLKNLALGIEEARNFNLEKAEKIFREVHDAHPHEKSPIINLVVCLMQQGKLTEAETLLTPFKEKNEVDAIPWILLGHVLNEQKRRDEAYNCYTTAIMFTHNIDRYGAINLNIREMWKKREEKTAPNNPISPSPTNETRSNPIVRDTPQSEEDFKEISKIDGIESFFPKSLLDLNKEGRPADLLRHLWETNVNNHNFLTDKAAEIVKMLRGASKSYQRNRPKNGPDDIVEAYCQRVESMLGLKKETNPEDIFRELAGKKGHDIYEKCAMKLLLLKIRALNKLGEDGETDEKIQETQFPPGHHTEDPTQRLKREADKYYTAGKINQARETYLEYLKHVPDDAEAWCRLGEMSLDAGKKQRAEREFEACLKLDPNNVHAQDRLNQLKRSRETKK